MFNSTLNSTEMSYVVNFRNTEIQHFEALNAAAGGNFTNCTYTFPGAFDNLTQFWSMAQIVTSVGEGAFIGAQGNLSDPALRVAGATIQGNEARQNSKLREFLGLDFFNGDVFFDTPLSASQAYSLAEPFFSCPASNAPIDFTLIPPINASFVADMGNTTSGAAHAAGSMVQVVWNASYPYLGTDVGITVLNGPNAIHVPMTQMNATMTGTGMGMFALPSGVAGTAFVVATNFNGEGPIPDHQNFGIGALVVA